ncbi:hypothetical protein [Spiroplasma clarkii]|uniref:hypothetical protein n=1 Tax=Spiroplasma clarkii TaxID=2139 RepID=UPI0011BAD2BB|nr:hypothetical protein [Spiroplasma clarkii]
MSCKEKNLKKKIKKLEKERRQTKKQDELVTEQENNDQEYFVDDQKLEALIAKMNDKQKDTSFLKIDSDEADAESNLKNKSIEETLKNKDKDTNAKNVTRDNADAKSEVDDQISEAMKLLEDSSETEPQRNAKDKNSAKKSKANIEDNQDGKDAIPGNKTDDNIDISSPRELYSSLINTEDFDDQIQQTSPKSARANRKSPSSKSVPPIYNEPEELLGNRDGVIDFRNEAQISDPEIQQKNKDYWSSDWRKPVKSNTSSEQEFNSNDDEAELKNKPSMRKLNEAFAQSQGKSKKSANANDTIDDFYDDDYIDETNKEKLSNARGSENSAEQYFGDRQLKNLDSNSRPSQFTGKNKDAEYKNQNLANNNGDYDDHDFYATPISNKDAVKNLDDERNQLSRQNQNDKATSGKNKTNLGNKGARTFTSPNDSDYVNNLEDYNQTPSSQRAMGKQNSKTPLGQYPNDFRNSDSGYGDVNNPQQTASDMRAQGLQGDPSYLANDQNQSARRNQNNNAPMNQDLNDFNQAENYKDASGKNKNNLGNKGSRTFTNPNDLDNANNFENYNQTLLDQRAMGKQGDPRYLANDPNQFDKENQNGKAPLGQHPNDFRNSGYGDVNNPQQTDSDMRAQGLQGDPRYLANDQNQSARRNQNNNAPMSQDPKGFASQFNNEGARLNPLTQNQVNPSYDEDIDDFYDDYKTDPTPKSLKI